MYSIFAKAMIENQMRERKDRMIAALYSNPNSQDSSVDLPSVVQEMEDQFQEAVYQLWLTEEEREEMEKNDPFKTNPFFTAMKLPHIETPEKEKIAAKVLSGEIEID